jgi:parvulin-like peptidyl-prolyl isomerase
MNGLGAGALLHDRFPEQSAAAHSAANAVADRLRAGSTFEEELLLHLDAQQAPHKDTRPKAPSPSSLGAAVSAEVASMEPGNWSGPLKTAFGWELILLVERMEATRNRAPVSLYRMQFPVGADADRQQAVADWSTLPLSGNAELMDCLAVEFRRNRPAPPEQK